MSHPERALIFAALVAAAAGCSHHEEDDGTAPVQKTTAKAELPPLSVRDDSPNLMLTWVDDKGDTHVEVSPGEVPMLGRDLVRVVVSDRDEGTHDQFYVADLTKKEPDGSYATHTMSRRDWEGVLEKRRSAFFAKTAPPDTLPNPSPGPSDPAPTDPSAPRPVTAATVIIYGASWCGPCHQAADYLKSKGIPYVMKDIQSTPGARQEMDAKLEKVGRRGGSIPVIDVRGEVIVGFSAAAVDRALAKVRGATPL